MPLWRADLYRQFKTLFETEPLLVESPGRINLIGEHTDYNNGFVLPAAIDKSIVLAMGPNNLNRVRLFANDMEISSFEVDLSDDIHKSKLHWPNYILGCIDQLHRSGYQLRGFDCVFGGDIPIGAGLSSSAALEGGIIFGLSILFDLGLHKKEIVRLAQKAENEFVGVQCGIMDQFANIYGQSGQVIQLDCRSLDHTYFPFLQDDIHIVLCDTNVRRELASSEYNVRRKQCQTGVDLLKTKNPDINSLRDVTIDLIQDQKTNMDPVVYDRCRYVVEENQRVLSSCEDLQEGNMDSFGQKMFESHYGLRDLYEVSCDELDLLVEVAESMDGVIGSRMMGGGFGGCTINLVKADRLDDVTEEFSVRYLEKTGQKPSIHIAKIGHGTRVVTPNE